MSHDGIATAEHLTLAGATRVLDAALAAAREMGRSFCIAVTDPSGEPIVTVRMDGAPRMSAGIAADKAFSVCGFNGMPTHRWWDAIKDEPALAEGMTHTPRLVVFGGGVGIKSDDALVGAIGVSGGSSAEDLAVAKAGAASMVDESTG
ncbi:MAG: heme-binding protein [Ilumatobacter sp.]